MNRSINAMKHLNEALQGLTAVGVEGWKLTDELPDTNELTGVPISDSDFLKIWDRNGGLLIPSLIKKHEGESKEVAGHWVLSTEPVTSIPDSLFDPQFCLNYKDFEVAKWMDTIRKAMDSKYKDT